MTSEPTTEPSSSPERHSATSLFDVAGKHVVVTGGTRGIGFMIAKGFVDAGAHVLIAARKADQVAAAAADLGGIPGIVADLSTAAGAKALAAEVLEWSPRLDVLVNNAGATWGAPIEDFPEDGFDKVIDTNVKGPFYLAASLLPALREAATAEDPARIINIGSVDGIRSPILESYPYSASKAAVHQLTHHLAARLAREHITVNAIAPGPFDSKMMAFALQNDEMRAAVAGSVPLGRIGRPDDMAGTAIFLASRAGSYLTGAVIPVDGGIVGAAS